MLIYDFPWMESSHDHTIHRTVSQGGSGIRMPDRGPVGWLPLEPQKKKKDFINFLLDEALLSPNVNDISSIYYIELKSTKICEQIVKIACIFNACRQI